MVLVRRERPGDAGAIRAVHDAAFAGPAEGRLVDALRAGRRLAVSLVAEECGEIVGHVAFSPVAAGGAPDGLGLAPLGVLPVRQRGGIGSRLAMDGLAACREAGAGFVVVLGEPSYYRRFGFTPAAGWGLLDGYGGGPAFQVLELRRGAIPRGAGLVSYAREFALAARGQRP